MSRLLILSIFFSVFSTIANGQGNSQSFKLEYFSSIPSAIDGCSGLYTYDTSSLKLKRYIFISDLQDLAFIKVNGKQIVLKKINDKEFSQKVTKSTYKGGGYTIILTTKSQKLVDEVSFDIGTIEILKDTFKLVIKIHGESGC